MTVDRGSPSSELHPNDEALRAHPLLEQFAIHADSAGIRAFHVAQAFHFVMVISF